MAIIREASILSPLRPFSSSVVLRRSKVPFRKLLVESLEARVVFAADGVDLVGPIQFVPTRSPDQLWSTTPGVIPVEGRASYIHPMSSIPVALDHGKLMERLTQAPLEFTPLAESSPIQINLPTPSGKFARFNIVSSPIMAPELAAQFPEIQTFSGQGIDDPAATLRFDVTPVGFHAQVLSPSGAYYIDPFWHLDNSAYISYYKSDLMRTADRVFVEGEILVPNAADSAPAGAGDVSAHAHGGGDGNGHGSGCQCPICSAMAQVLQCTVGLPGKTNPSIAESGALLSVLEKVELDSSTWQTNKAPDGPTLSRAGTQLKVYDLANAATAEYTAFHGGTVALGQAAIVTAVNRVTGIYENELSVRLVLVANNSALVYTNASTDPYNNTSPSQLLSQNQSNIDTVIGNANYDIGHVFSTGGGGLAGLGVVGVTGQKARGETGLGAPIADAFYVDYVAHEMGHQFGGNHTFNSSTGSCSGNRSASAAYEPGSGSTIQAYAGICGADNLQPNSDPYFHSISFDEMISYISQGAGLNAATIVNTGNSVPRVNAGPDYVIPAQTPFVLRAAGADNNVGDVPTYNWEQRDLGASTSLTTADNGSSPLFRSFNPTISGDRTFPRLTELLNNTTAVGEKLPTAARTMDFRATARDNRSGGGAVNTDDMIVTVVNTGSAFAVTSPNTAVTWPAGSSQDVTWDVAGTTAAPINTTNVNIWLSTNGGLTFSILLAANVANDGTETVVMPNIASTQARIKVEPTNSIYFDVSNANFTISSGTNSAPTISTFGNRVMNFNTSTGDIAFTVEDAQTAAQDLVVTASSSNSVLLPGAAMVLGGSGTNRTLNLTPAAGQFGASTVYVHVTDAGGLTSTSSFQLYVEGILACTSLESFDGVTAPALPSGWTTSASGVSAANWTTSTTSSDSGSNNAFVPNPSNISDSLMTSPSIAVTAANRTFQFRHNYNLEATYDGAVLEISVNGGAFVDLLTAGGNFLSGGYVTAIEPGFQSPIIGRQAWTGSSGGYITTVAELPVSTLGQNVRLRFRMASDNSTAAVGWRVDTLQTCGFTSPSVLTITATDANKNEGNSGTTSYNFTISRTVDLTSSIDVQYAVNGSGGIAATASDFGGALPSGTVSFAAGESSKSLAINVTGDTQVEASEGFTVTLSGATGGATIGTAAANGVIIDDDNIAPSDLAISQTTVAENVVSGTTVGELTTVDGNSGDVFVYALVSGEGDTDNGSFAIAGTQLRTGSAVNFETKNSYTIRVRSTDVGGLSVDKSLTIAVVDLAEFSAPVQIGDGTAQRSSVKNVVVTFDGAIVIAPGAFVVDKLGTSGGVVTTSHTTVVNGSGQTVVTLEFSGSFTRGTAGLLSDGYYRLTIDGTKITRGTQQLDANGDGIGGDVVVLGAVESDNFFALYGDASGDGLIGVAEFGLFRSSFGKGSGDPGYDDRFEYEGDSTIGVSDFGQFRSRFGKPKMPF